MAKAAKNTVIRARTGSCIASPRVSADMVEAMEFPELSERYSVYGVPRTVIMGL